MRFTNWFLGIAGVAAIAASGLVGCGSSSSGNTGGGSTSTGTKSGSTSTGTGTGAGATSTGTSPTSTGTSMGGPCSPHSSCPSPADAVGCVGLVDNKGQTTFGLRMSQLDITKPAALKDQVISSVIGGAVEQNLPQCNLGGTATFNWLFQFDTTAGTLKTGGAKPVSDPTMGYSFDTSMVMGFDLSPITLMTKPDATGKFSVTKGQDLIVPIFLDAAAMSVVLLPLKAAEISMGTLSDDNNCIGSYNAATLDPANSCMPDATHPAYTDGAALTGYITLKDANNVNISALNASLCAFLAGLGNSMYVTQMGSESVCKTDSSGNVVYKGDWCAGTMPGDPGMAATSSCADSVQLNANFAASSVKIN